MISFHNLYGIHQQISKVNYALLFQMYCVPIKAADRGRLTEDEICCQLMHILDDAPCLASPPPVGILTASNRHHWADAREALCFGKEMLQGLLDCNNSKILINTV